MTGTLDEHTFLPVMVASKVVNLLGGPHALSSESYQIDGSPLQVSMKGAVGSPFLSFLLLCPCFRSGTARADVFSLCLSSLPPSLFAFVLTLFFSYPPFSLCGMQASRSRCSATA